MRKQLQEERAAGVRDARARAETAVAQAKSALHTELEGLKKNLEAESDALADRIANKILRGRAA
jgi:hypothetical protein